MAGMESEPRNDYWTFYVVVNSNTKQSGWSLGGGVVFGFALLGTSSEWREKHIAYITPTTTSTASASILTEMKRVVERKEKKVTDVLGLRFCSLSCAHTLCIIPRVRCCSLSTEKQIAAVILDLLTKPYCANTKLITSTHICSHVHRLDLSGQGLTAGDDLFVCGCDWQWVCARIYVYICLPLYCMCVCLWESAFDACECLCAFLAICACTYIHLYTRVCVDICACMSHSSCRYFISLLRLGEAAQLGMHCDSYNLTNWNGGGFGLNLS